MKGSYQLPCGDGVINDGRGVESNLGVLPFLSATAAVLILAEMIKMPLPDYPYKSNFIELSMRNMGSSIIQYRRGPSSECICRSQNLQLYPNQIKGSKFWKFSASIPKSS